MEHYLFTNEELNETLKIILSEENLRDNIYIAGGISCYLDNEIKSIRKHHDFDFYVDIHNMNKVRQGLDKIKATVIRDSLIEDGEEKGLDVIINGIKAEFVPFALINNKIKILRNYNKNKYSWKDGSSLFINNKSIYDIFENITVYNHIPFRKIKSNVLYAIKKYLYDNDINNREKDIQDIKYLENKQISTNSIMLKNDVDFLY